MSLYPNQVPIDEKQIARLTSVLKNAYQEILAEIETATNFGVANRKAILAQIEGILTDIGTDIESFVEKEVKKQYELGAGDAVKQLYNTGAEVNVREGFNRIHRQAIDALVSDTSKAFAQSLTGVNRSAQFILGRATREMLTQKIATGLIGGKALREVKQQIVGILEEKGLDALIDKGGKRWTLDRYSEMLFRTKAVEARNRGFVNRVAENGYDLAQVSAHGGSCDICVEWEGKIISTTGETPGYPTLADAEAAGLFHPNCRHAINALIPKLARETNAYDPETKTVVIKQ